MNLVDDLNKALAARGLTHRATLVEAPEPELNDDGIEIAPPGQRTIVSLQMSGRVHIYRHLYDGTEPSREHQATFKRGEFHAIIAATIATLAGVSPSVAENASANVVSGAASARTEGDVRAVFSTFNHQLRAATDAHETEQKAKAQRAVARREGYDAGYAFDRRDPPIDRKGGEAIAWLNGYDQGHHDRNTHSGDGPGCGCCRGPEGDRCICHIHQDISRGRPARTCTQHGERK